MQYNGIGKSLVEAILKDLTHRHCIAVWGVSKLVTEKSLGELTSGQLRCMTWSVEVSDTKLRLDSQRVEHRQECLAAFGHWNT